MPAPKSGMLHNRVVQAFLLPTWQLLRARGCRAPVSSGGQSARYRTLPIQSFLLRTHTPVADVGSQCLNKHGYWHDNQELHIDLIQLS